MDARKPELQPVPERLQRIERRTQRLKVTLVVGFLLVGTAVALFLAVRDELRTGNSGSRRQPDDVPKPREDAGTGVDLPEPTEAPVTRVDPDERLDDRDANWVWHLVREWKGADIAKTELFPLTGAREACCIVWTFDHKPGWQQAEFSIWLADKQYRYGRQVAKERPASPPGSGRLYVADIKPGEYQLEIASFGCVWVVSVWEPRRAPPEE